MPGLTRATSPVLAAWAGTTSVAGATEGRLYQRFRRVGAARLVVAARAAGLPVICLKGMAVAHLAYPDPDLRPMADLDLLVPASHLAELVAWLRSEGLEFAPAGSRSPWGLIGDASLRPMLAADRQLNVDIHSQPDAWPLHLALDQARVAAQAGVVGTDAGEIAVPCITHLLVLAASHAARDLFALDTAKNLVDGIMLLVRRHEQVDWQELNAIADRAGLGRGFGVYFALLAALAGDAVSLPERWRHKPASLSQGRFDRLLDTFVRGDTSAATLALPAAEKARREWDLTGPRIALGRWRRRLAGLVAPADGLPRGQEQGWHG